MTLGCGSWGGNVTSDNVSPIHLMDIKRVAWETKPVGAERLKAKAAAVQTASPSAAVVKAQTESRADRRDRRSVS